MDEIKVGDLVMVVGLKRCGCGLLGTPRKVIGLLTSGRRGRCVNCYRVTYPIGTKLAICEGMEHGNYEVSRLKRIDPPALPESTDQPEELTA